MRMCKMMVIVLVMAVMAMPALAQESQKEGRQREKKANAARLNPLGQAMVRIEMLHAAAKKLDLTEEQQASLKKIHESVGPKMEEVMKKAAEIIGQEKMKEVMEVVAKAKEAGKNPRQVAMAAEEALKLTDEQKKKLEPLGKELAAATRKLVKEINGVLTEEQREKLSKEMTPGRRGGKKKQG